MKMYISQDERKSIRKNYPTVITDKVFVIDVQSLMEELLPNNEPIDFLNLYLFNQSVFKKMQMVYHSKRYKDVLYLIDTVDRPFIFAIKKFLKDSKIFITDFILLDYSQTLNPKIYKFFSNVL